jgi:hypothetical protein
MTTQRMLAALSQWMLSCTETRAGYHIPLLSAIRGGGDCWSCPLMWHAYAASVGINALHPISAHEGSPQTPFCAPAAAAKRQRGPGGHQRGGHADAAHPPHLARGHLPAPGRWVVSTFSNLLMRTSPAAAIAHRCIDQLSHSVHWRRLVWWKQRHTPLAGDSLLLWTPLSGTWGAAVICGKALLPAARRGHDHHVDRHGAGHRHRAVLPGGSRLQLRLVRQPRSVCAAGRTLARCSITCQPSQT